jgi:predicted dehydrogenase/threonine dehydrogenase-like Zn-dependent dehydrogenase
MRARLRDLAPRVRAVRPRPGSLTGSHIVWGGGGYVELIPTMIPPPAGGEVTVQVHVSAVSPGTERAQYLRLPNTSQRLPPGYSVAGTVVAVGAGVEELAPGDRVAAYGVSHTSVANVAAGDVYPIPAGVPMEAAALTHLGVIAGQGVEKAGLARGEPLAVVGAGVIGLLAQRLATVRGAGPATVLATSSSKEEVARRGADDFVVVGSDDIRLGVPAVIEAAGSPESLHVAIEAAGVGARIVLLGSPRGMTHGVSFDAVREKQLTLIGAHVSTLELVDPGARRREAVRFLDHLASGLEVEDLVGEGVDPREPEAFFRRLVEDSRLIGAHFDWSLLAEEGRAARAPAFRVPTRLRRRLAPPRPFVAPDDPFSGSEGQLRLALCGCGEIAVANAQAAASAPNVRLAAAFDPQLALAEDLAGRFGGRAHATFEALLESDDVDAVFLCVPHHLHSPLAIQAAEAGKHVIVEKPPANDLAGAAAMVAAAESAGVTLSVCFPHRYEPKIRAARHLIRAGALGELDGATIKLFLDKPLAYWWGGYTGRSHSDWRRSPAQAGGGVLIMNVSHYLDLLRHLSDLEVENVAAFTRPATDSGEVEETASVTFRLSNGAVATVLGGSSVRGEESTEFRLWGSDGHLEIEPQPRVFSLRAVGGLGAGSWHGYGGSEDYDIRAAYLSRLATAIARADEPEVDARDALAVQAVMEAVYRSAATGEVVRPSELLAEART